MKISPIILFVFLLSGFASLNAQEFAKLKLTTLDNGHVIVPLFIGESGPYRFLIDTGSDRIVLDASLKEKVGLELTGNASMRGAGSGRQPIEIARPVELRDSKSKSESQLIFSHNRPVVMPLGAALGAAAKLPFDGIVGLPLFEKHVVQLDVRAGEVRFYKEPPKTNNESLLLPITIERGFPFLNGSFTPKPESKSVGPIDGKFMIDTGSFHAIMIDWPIVKKHQLLDKSDANQSIVEAGSGIGGKIAPFRSSPISELILCDNVIKLSNVVLRTAAGGRPPVSGRIGNIGMGFLSDYVTTLDYTNKKILLEKYPGQKNG